MLKRSSIALCGVLAGLVAATALNVAVMPILPPGPRGAAVALLCVAKAALVVYGFMRLHKENPALARFLVGYAVLMSCVAGVRVAFAG
ncbi:cytochrome C oxidase subunit IV family protein [Xanthobacter autotrophicus]|uniref:cytochrome C oxidase subunit IV family protein n=1 Tax=Xanthobacter autotrophicus TaxID=280 RepID=UPI003728128A